MASERKKKRFSLKNFKFKKNNKKRSISKASDASENKQSSRLTVVNGKRKRNRIIRYITYAVIAVVIIAVIIINFLTPTGIIEALQNSYAAMGSGKFPINIYSSNASSFYSWNDMLCIVNDTFFELYNDDGKLVQAVSHGMINPVLEMSEARYLLFDRDRYSLSVYNYSDKLISIDFENTIMSADIGRDGTFAVVLDSDTYQSTVVVFDKDTDGNETVFKWNSAEYYITDVAVCDDGEKIAISLLHSVGGAFESYIYILDSEDNKSEPVSKFKFDGVVSSLTSVNEDYLIAGGFDNAYSVFWNGKDPINLNISGVIHHFDYDDQGNSVIVFGREDNAQTNSVLTIKPNGKTHSVFSFNETVFDVCILENKVALLSDSKVLVYKKSGEMKGTYNSKLKGIFVGLCDDGKILVLDNSKLLKIK